MNPWLQMGITRKFLIFFLVTAILPIVTLSALIVHSVNTKFDDRISSQLHSGMLFSKELYQEDLHKLELVSNQAVLFSVTEKYRYYLKTGNFSPLDTLLNLYQKSKGLDIVTLVDDSGNAVASTAQPQIINKKVYQAMIRAALRGKVVSGVERFKDPTQNKYILTYLAVAPVFSAPNSKKVIGGLITGINIDEDSSIKRLSRILPGLDVRIFVKTPTDYQLLLSTVPDAEKTASPKLTALFNQALYRLYQPIPPSKKKKSRHRQHGAPPISPRPFQDNVNNTPYKSTFSIITNFYGSPVGYMVVSTSEKDEEDLKRTNFRYIGMYLLMGLIFISLLGAWFKRSFVNPMNELAGAADEVATGNLNIRLKPPLATANEMSQTLNNFNKMLDQLQENERLRGTFVSTLTHDLRTPLIAQKRVLEVFEEEFKVQKDSQLESLANGLLKSNDSLLDMVNKLLETYQYEDGKIKLLLESIDLNQLIEACFADMGGLAQSQKISLVNHIPQSFPIIQADLPQLKRVFLNLIGNALENIHPRSTIEINATEQNGSVTIQVKDNGPGINPDILPHIFTRYFTGHRIRQKIGSGLGLFICRMIIDLHGGTIQVESTLGKGTCFTITIPKAPMGLS